ncbi:hypothetical protein SPRG_22258 [Saprolegnia parasitica CBS 223.65]|uniref:Major facilitator superfamily (MFS) profile domain-containing protein n=1 Tax=Saprolegnia parasitica (strain CBS 223.65) TaxID=695850 RepID=A0A067C2H4_SAPPC|nr:hypothetical protein SPRG_22258 [Saprolegnia parasitica CBS 223.65]KDO24683.1 hypothetical protein SPRG_22258 [Saprolegnia parasitica CBS 223.65]|eukprot:XP_012204629.1 hypothetical protein SPRG_22258 [Saprolegnia parasitica CBS 223.65]
MRTAADCVRGALLLSASFFLIFTSYAAIENLETSIIPGACTGCKSVQDGAICQLGDVCVHKVQFACDVACAAPYSECKCSMILGVNYLLFSVSSLAGPFVPALLGEKTSMVLGSISYTTFGIANFVVAVYPSHTTMHWWIMLPAAVFSGVSASFLWIAQGSYLTQLSVHYAEYMGLPETSSMGFFHGIFFGIFKCSQIAGNLISSFVLGTLGWTTASLFLMYVGISCTGTLLLWFSIEEQAPLSPLSTPTETTRLLHAHQKHSVLATVRAVLTMALDKRMLTLTPLLLFNGIQQGFVSSEFTSTIVRQSLGQASIGNIMAIFGVVNVASSYGFGRLADTMGTLYAQILGFTALLAAYVVCLLLPLARCDNQWTIMVGLSILLSIGDASSTTLANVVLGQDFAHDSLRAFSLFRSYHAGAASLSFFFLRYLSLDGRLYLLMTTLLLGIALFVVHHLGYAPRK